MFARTYNLVLAGLWLGVAFCLLAPDNLVPEVVRGKLGGDQATLGGMLALVFAAIPFAFGALRSGGLGKRIFLGVVVATVWYLLQRAIDNLAAVYLLNHIAVNVAPAALLVVAGSAYFHRA